MSKDALVSFVDKVWDESIVPELVEYIKIPNKSPVFDPQWKENGHMDKAVEQISAWCKAQPIEGLTVEVIELEGRTPLIYMEIPGETDDTVLLYGHLDKQPEMEGWFDDLDPWKPVIKGDKLYGRGGADDGYSAYGSLTAIRALREHGGKHARCVVIIEGCEDSLRRLKTDHIDLYQMHAPDPATPIDETLSALDDLVRQGKVRYVGTSNYRAYELAKALGVSERLNLARFDCNQPRYNILYREIESEILPLCDAEGVGTIAYNPLAGGFLTGKYESTEDLQEGTRFTLGDAGPRYRARYWDEVQFDEVQRLKSYFSERGISLTHAAIAWCVEQPGITSAIVGASRAEQVVDSLAYQDIELSEDDLAFCDEPWYNLPRQKDPNLALR